MTEIPIDSNPQNDEASLQKKEAIRKRLENSSRMVEERRKERLTNEDSVVVKTNEFWGKFNELKKTINFAERKTALSILKDLEALLNSYYEQIADYDKRQATEQIKELNGRVAPAKRKKFSFGARKQKSTKQKKDEVKKVEKSAKVDEHNNTTAVLFENKSNAYLTHQTDTIEDHMIRDCDGCTVSVNSITGTCFLRNLTNCHIRMGPIQSSCFIRDCKNCTFDLPAKQIRIHTSSHCSFQLYVTSDPIIEHSNNLTFSEYSYSYPKKQFEFEKTPFLSLKNKFDQVRDFNWLKMDHSPNWKLGTSVKTTYTENGTAGRPKESILDDDDDDEI